MEHQQVIRGGRSGVGKRKRKREHVSFETLVNPNFEELARQYPAFHGAYYQALSKKTKGKPVDYGATPEFRLELCRALLHTHWNLRLPTFDSTTNLCPPVPNRYYFVQWLLSTVLPNTSRWFRQGDHHGRCPEHHSTASPLRVLDIGTGAAAIYSLLVAATSAAPRTEVYATDVNPESVQHARMNVAANQPHLWTERHANIHVLTVEPCERQQRQRQQPPFHLHQEAMSDFGAQVTSLNNGIAHSSNDSLAIPKGPLRCSLDAIAAWITDYDHRDHISTFHQLDVCLTNPPFFDVDEEQTPRTDGMDRTAMTHQEGSYPGGEFAFVIDMIVDALYLLNHAPRLGENDCDNLPQLALSSKTRMMPPRWSACMCGKKTTFVKLRGILHYLLGPSHVASTEFGPGFMTRWFLAWNVDLRPRMDSPLATTKSFSFDVSLSPIHNDPSPHRTPVDEIETRIRDYCASFPGVEWCVNRSPMPTMRPNAGYGLRVTIHPRHSEICTDQDDTLPEPLRQIVSTIPVERRLEWLPQEGHCCVELRIQPLKSSAAATTSSTSNPSSVVHVSVTTYAHNKVGQTVLEKIHVQLESEITRTNRKWRRILQRQQQEQQNQQQQQGQHNSQEAMDET